MKKASIPALLSFVLGLQVQAQHRTFSNESVSKPIQQIFNEAHSYIDSVEARGGESDDPGGEGDEELFFRWEDLARPRSCYPSCTSGGDFLKANDFARQMSTSSSFGCTNGNPWNQVGPTYMDKQNIGVISSVALDVNNPNIIYAGSYNGGLFKTTNGGSTWTNITDGNIFVPSIGVNDIVIDPSNSSILYIACSGNNLVDSPYSLLIYKSTNSGSTWSATGLTPPSNSKLQIQKLIISPTGKLYAFGKESNSTSNNFVIYKSTNGGSSWTSYNTGLFAGVNWAFAGSQPYWCEAKFDLGNENNIFATLTRENQTPILLSTTSGGTSWSSISIPVGGAVGRIGIDTKAGSNGVFYALSRIQNQTTDQFQIHTTNNNGASWTLVNTCNSSNLTTGSNGNVSQPISCPVAPSNPAFPCEFGFWFGNFIVSDNVANTFYFSDLYVRKSSNSGSSFATITEYYPSATTAGTHADIRIMKKYNSSIAGQDVLLIGCDGGIAISYNSGVTWTNINGTGLGVAQCLGVDFFESTNEVITGGQDVGTLFNQNSNYWAHMGNGDGNPPAVDKTKAGRVYRGANGSFAYSDTKGICVSPNGSIGSFSGFGPQTIPVIDPNNVDNVFFYHMNKKVVKRNTLNNTWITVFDAANYGVTAGQAITTAFSACKGDPNFMIIALEGPTWGGAVSKKLFKTTNGGTTWTDISSSFVVTGAGNLYSWNYVNDIAIDPHDPHHILAAMAGYDGTITQGTNRVIESWDYGTTWQSRSTGLPGFPVNKILFQEGTTVVWAGTDVGVYRLASNSATSWDCYSNGLPAAIIRDIKINACLGKIIVATYGRGIWQANLPVFNSTQPIYSTDPSGIINWYGYTSINNNIEIVSGDKLHLYGFLSVAQGKKIIIDAGAQLILHPGSKITNNCNHTWDGIEVAGVSSALQNSGQQGLVSMNNATIEHAQTAITTMGTDAVGNLDWSKCGGIVQATNSYFLNNRKSVAFLAYGPNSASFFDKCTFNTTQALRDLTIPDNHVSIYAVKNILFRGCYFGYNAGTAYPVGNRYSGIYSIDGSYLVTQICTSPFLPCGSYQKCTFENLDYGIFFTSSNRLQYPKINNSIFLNNSYAGMRIEGSDYPEIIANTLTTANLNNSHGIYLDQCSYYKVENNAFNGQTSATNLQTGIFINKSGSAANQIYRNSFNNLYQGCAALKTNSHPVANQGLQMKCCTFTSNKYDITVLGDPTYAGVIKQTQGTQTTPIGNWYSAVCSNGNRFYKDGYSPQQVIHYSNSTSNTQPSPQPACSPLNVLISSYGAPAYAASSTCPDLQPSGSTNPTPQQRMSDINNSLSALRANYNSAVSNYNSLIDGGSTTAMLSLINSSTDNNSLKSHLDANSPYLSDEVLSAYFARSGVPETYIVAVHNENKPVTAAIYAQLQAMGLSSSAMSDIEAQQGDSLISERGKKEIPISALQSEISAFVDDKVRMFLSDSTLQNPDSVIYILSNDFTRQNNQTDAVLAYLNRNDYSHASSLIANIESNSIEPDFCTLYQNIITLDQSADLAYEMNSNATIKSQMEDLANKPDNLLSKNAQALLRLVFNNDYPSEILYPQEGSSRLASSVNIESGSSEKLEDGVEVKFYPNPADESMIIDLSGVHNMTEVELVDMLGRSVISFTFSGDASKIKIPTGQLKQGLYSISLTKTDGKVMHLKNKLSIAH